MERRQKRTPAPIINPGHFGVSFSLKQCREFKIDQIKALEFLISDLGFRRFRLMSYWDEHETTEGNYNFRQLDAQINMIEKAGGEITLCLGARQPRWPESHWPKWALEIPQAQRYDALCTYIEAVVNRYKSRSCIRSYQLENEALNHGFGLQGDFSRARLRREYDLIKQLDPLRPLIMSTSNTYGLPVRRPRPDQFGFTFYRHQFKSGIYNHSKLPWWWYRARAWFIQLVTRRRSFIHELQAEPWGPKSIWEMPVSEQDKSMSTTQLKTNIELAIKTKLYPIDFWGGEWWYWRHVNGDKEIARTVRDQLISVY